ncbi:hypothetical protein [Nitratifractor sp.]
MREWIDEDSLIAEIISMKIRNGEMKTRDAEEVFAELHLFGDRGGKKNEAKSSSKVTKEKK